MKKLIGYTMFWIAVGMVLMLIISDVWIAVIIIAFFAYSWLQFVSLPVVRVLVWIVSIIGWEIKYEGF